MEVSGQLYAPAAFWEPGIQWIGGWVGPRSDLDVVAKRKDPIIAAAGN